MNSVRGLDALLHAPKVGPDEAALFDAGRRYLQGISRTEVDPALREAFRAALAGEAPLGCEPAGITLRLYLYGDGAALEVCSEANAVVMTGRDT